MPKSAPDVRGISIERWWCGGVGAGRPHGGHHSAYEVAFCCIDCHKPVRPCGSLRLEQRSTCPVRVIGAHRPARSDSA